MRILTSWMVSCAIVCGLFLTSGCNSPSRVRVMSYNIHIGIGMDKKLDLERIAGVINAHDPDLVALQEVDRGTRRTGEVDQPAELARLTGMHVYFGKARDYSGGDYGQAILSRWPIEDAEVITLPGIPDREPRIAVRVRVRPPAGPREIVFVGTHLDHQIAEARMAQIKKLRETIESDPAPAKIVVGDFNAFPDSEEMAVMFEAWQDTTPADALTFRADRPDRKIDYVLIPRSGRWRVIDARVLDEPVASDHLPVLVDLQWR